MQDVSSNCWSLFRYIPDGFSKLKCQESLRYRCFCSFLPLVGKQFLPNISIQNTFYWLLRVVHIKRLNVLLVWRVVPIVHHVILNFTHCKGTTFYRYHSRRSFSCCLYFSLNWKPPFLSLIFHPVAVEPPLVLPFLLQPVKPNVSATITNTFKAIIFLIFIL